MMRGLAVAAVPLATSVRAATIEVDTSGNPPAIVAISGKLELGDEDALRTKTANLSRGGSQVTSAYMQLAALIHGEAVELTSDDDEGGDSSEVEKAAGETEELEDELEARDESAAAVIPPAGVHVRPEVIVPTVTCEDAAALSNPPAGSVHLICVDPPYYNNAQFQRAGLGS